MQAAMLASSAKQMTRAAVICCKPKKNGDHKQLKPNWIPHSHMATVRVAEASASHSRQPAMTIARYRGIQATGNAQPGGVQLGLASD